MGSFRLPLLSRTNPYLSHTFCIPLTPSYYNLIIFRTPSASIQPPFFSFWHLDIHIIFNSIFHDQFGFVYVSHVINTVSYIVCHLSFVRWSIS